MAKKIKGLSFILPKSVKDKKVSVIEVGPFNETALAQEINRFLGTNIEQLNRINTYLLVHSPELSGLETLIDGKPFVDTIIHRATLNKALISELELPFDYVLQSMLNPGTSDAEGDTALRQALLTLDYEFKEGDTGFYSKQYFLQGNLELNQLEEVSAFLANPDLNIRLIVSEKEYKIGKKITAPIVTLKPEIRVGTFDIVNMTDEELLNLSSKRKLAATLEEMQQFRDIYRDENFLDKRKAVGLNEKATDVELETWFGLRSEHCFHKELNAHITLEDKVDDPIFGRTYEKGWLTKNENGEYILEKGLFKTFIEEPARDISAKLDRRGNNWIASMFEDNSGVVYYDENNMFCIKFETHNSPSNKEPIQGAKTGIDGVNRDIFGTMRGTFDAIANFFFYCTGDPHYRGWLPKGVKHPYTILKGITQGVREGGNESQIPTLGGGLIVDPRYIAKCLVYCGTIGWSPVESVDGINYIGKEPNVGDLVFVAGQPVGIDGVHGATESSLIADANISLGHVQADFSFIQAKMKEYLLEAARDNLFTSKGDCGAMGISVTLELAEETGGLELDLEKHPKKYAGIQPWQIVCSETQDRMVPIAKPENKEELLKRAKLHDVQLTELGELTDSGYAHLKYGNKTVALIDLEKLDDKNPRKRMHATWNGSGKQSMPEIERKYSLEESLCMVIAQPDVASKEWFFRQKDSSVKGATIQSPLVGLNQEVEADATIQKPLDTEDTEGKDYGAIAYALGITPKLSDIDAYYSAQKSFVDMVGKIIAIGGVLPDMKNPKWDAWAVCGNYCQPNSESKSTLSKEDGEHNLASFVREGMGIREAEEALNIPVISGKDSMKCSCIYDLELDEFLANSDSEFAKAFMGLPNKVREDLDKVRDHLGDAYNAELLESIVFEAMPLDLRRHVIMVERKVKKKDKDTGEEYEVKTKSIEIHDPDSYLASCAVKIQDYRKCVNSAFKQEGDLIYVIGTTKNHLGASQYLSAVGYEEDGMPKEGGVVPQTDFSELSKIAKGIHEAIDSELVASCKYVESGGIGIALSKTSMAGEKGANIIVDKIYQDGSCNTQDELLYSETPGRFIVTVAPKDKGEFVDIMMSNSVPYSSIGEVKNYNQLRTVSVDCICNINREVASLDKIKGAYQKPLRFDLDVAK